MDRVTLVRKYDYGLADLRNQLEEKRKEIKRIPQTAVIWNALGILIFFRILMMTSNYCY